jgi:hypothetical protein
MSEEDAFNPEQIHKSRETESRAGIEFNIAGSNVLKGCRIINRFLLKTPEGGYLIRLQDGRVWGFRISRNPKGIDMDFQSTEINPWYQREMSASGEAITFEGIEARELIPKMKGSGEAAVPESVKIRGSDTKGSITFPVAQGVEIKLDLSSPNLSPKILYYPSEKSI